MRLLLVRHGATANNLEARFTGQSDVDLSPLGELQAEALGRRLASEETLDAVISSDLSRALATAEAIVRYRQLPMSIDQDLREISMGEWEGLTYAEVVERDPIRAAEWRADSLHVAPPGGETTYQLRDRLIRAFDRWRAIYPDASIVWVTHGGVIGVLLCHLLGMDLGHRWQFRRDNAGITEVDVGIRAERPAPHERETTYAIVMRLNDTCHLHQADDVAATALAEERQVL
jgi:broad specificity phosphatase PhoE